jgi:leader peptidase (prepilin peptidase)/N-methyltransferase
VRLLGAVACALLGVPGGMFANLLVDRVPDKLPLRPLPGLAGQFRSPRRVIVVVTTVALYAGTVLRFGGDWVVPAYLVFFTSLVAISAIDFDRQIIPNRIVYPTIFLSVPLLVLAALAQGEWNLLRHALIGAALAWGALLVVHLISPAGMGFGDVRLAFVLGLFLGWISLRHVLSGLFLGVLLLSVLGVLLWAFRIRSLKDHMAFGPFLAAGAALAVFVGPAATRWLIGG